jgi:hypothetical protein
MDNGKFSHLHNCQRGIANNCDENKGHLSFDHSDSHFLSNTGAFEASVSFIARKESDEKLAK